MITSVHNHPNVIAKGWGGEPSKLILYFVENNTCYVGQEGSARTIGLPEDEVFGWDEALFEDLKSAFSGRDFHRLKKLYADISVDDFACNRYLNKVPSIHGQETLRSPEKLEASDSQ